MSLRESYDADGYVVVRGVFTPAEVAELEAAFDEIVRQLVASGEHLNARWGGEAMDAMGAADTVVLHTHNVQYYSAVWARALTHPGFLAAATEILGPDVVLHHTKLFQKPAENGAPFPMHQDWSYFPSRIGATSPAARTRWRRPSSTFPAPPMRWDAFEWCRARTAWAGWKPAVGLRLS